MRLETPPDSDGEEGLRKSVENPNMHNLSESYGNIAKNFSIDRVEDSHRVKELLNGLKTKYVKRDIKLSEKSKYSSANFTNKFIVTRVLGHPELQKDIDKWREVDD